MPQSRYYNDFDSDDSSSGFSDIAEEEENQKMMCCKGKRFWKVARILFVYVWVLMIVLFVLWIVTQTSFHVYEKKRLQNSTTVTIGENGKKE